MAMTKKVPTSMTKLQDFYIRNQERAKKIAEQGKILAAEMAQAAVAGGTAFLYGGVLGYLKQQATNNGETEYFDGKIFKSEDGTGGIDIGLIVGAASVGFGAFAASKKQKGADAVLGIGTGMLVPALHDLGYGIGMEMAKKS